MHAATMVTAGVYLLGRMFPFYQAEGFGAGLKPLILVIGALTLFLGGACSPWCRTTSRRCWLTPRSASWAT